MASHLARQYAPRCTIIPQQGLTTIIPPSSTTTSDTPSNASNTSRQIPHINTSNPASRGVHEASSERSLKQNSVPQMRPHRPLKLMQPQAKNSPPDETSPASIKRMQSQAEASRAPLSRGLSPHRKWRSPHMPQAAFFGLPLGFAFGLKPSLAVCHKVDRQANPHAFSSSQDWQPYWNRQRGQTPRPTPFTAS